jgi:hypothetical protein
VVFVDASSHETIETTLAGIAASRNLGKTYEDTLRWITSRGDGCLVIFDNADDPKLELSKYLPKSAEYNVLITTRYRDLAYLAQDAEAEYNVAGMDVPDAHELLLKTARLKQENLPQDEQDALVKLLQV